MSSDPDRRRRLSPARIAQAIIAALCAVGLMLAPLVAPSTGLAKPLASSAGPPPVRALEPPLPQPDPSGGGARQPPCRSTACRKRVAQFCKRVGGCGKFSERFRQTGRSGIEKFKKDHPPPADKFGNRTGWELHHTVQVGKNKGLSDFAQAVLERAGVKANVGENLVYLRGKIRQEGTKGYDDLSSTLQKRLFHSDARTNYYYQTVNDRLSELIHRVGDDPTADQVKAVLKKIDEQIKNLDNGGKNFIEPGKAPR